MNIIMDPAWTFKEIVNNIKAMRHQFEDVLLSFSNFEVKNERLFRQKVRDSIYALNFGEKKKNLIWEYMNGFIEFEKLEKECIRRKKNGRNRKNKKINRQS